MVCYIQSNSRLFTVVTAAFSASFTQEFFTEGHWLFYRAQEYEVTILIAVTVDFFKVTDDSVIESQFKKTLGQKRTI